MKVYVQMPITTPFKPGDIVLERGYEIRTTDGDKAAHQDVERLFFRPAATELAEGTDQAKLQAIYARLKAIAEEVAAL